MDGSPSSIVSLGFGSWGSIGLIVTLGYGIAAVTATLEGSWSDLNYIAADRGRTELHGDRGRATVKADRQRIEVHG